MRQRPAERSRRLGRRADEQVFGPIGKAVRKVHRVHVDIVVIGVCLLIALGDDKRQVVPPAVIKASGIADGDFAGEIVRTDVHEIRRRRAWLCEAQLELVGGCDADGPAVVVEHVRTGCRLELARHHGNAVPFALLSAFVHLDEHLERERLQPKRNRIRHAERTGIPRQRSLLEV